MRCTCVEMEIITSKGTKEEPAFEIHIFIWAFRILGIRAEDDLFSSHKPYNYSITEMV